MRNFINSLRLPRVRIGIRSLMFLILLLAIWLGWKAEKARIQRHVVQDFSPGNRLEYDYEIYSSSDFNFMNYPLAARNRENLIATQERAYPGLRRKAAFFIARHLGPEYAGDLTRVQLIHWPSDADLYKLKDLHYIEVLSAPNHNRGGKRRSRFASKGKITDSGLAYIEGFRHLRALDLTGSRIGGKGLSHLAGLQKLRSLNLSDTLTCDAALGDLTPLKELEVLELDGTAVGDEGARRLSRFRKLRRLSLNGTKVSEIGLSYLMKLPKLEYLDIGGTKISESDLAALRKTRPALSISNYFISRNLDF